MKKIILASNSPRRKEILKNMGLNFKTISSDIEEKVDENESPESIVMSLAFRKANDIFVKSDKDSIIIAADTIVFYNKVIGKPRSKKEAKEMLRLLSDNTHYVYTGVSIIDDKNKIIDFVKTKVVFKKLTDKQIDNYIETGEPLDKAGAYAIQGVGSVFVDSIEGDYFNVVGLPISRLSDILSDVFNIHIL
ncbi:nucleoside triphosphate pyrophosphatase [Helicovermis profundi]|uniref:dTTP/UTP pyrophosphatase n=1 Tax=Helicovermis profundi TaxID=3065157 RepID=A0AAU9ERD9_9FIRM|nr:Maf family protein [Clostridia bacterium S502]